MKNILFLLIFGLLLTSCKKDTITPGNYQAGTQPTNPPSNWQSGYGNGGVLPPWGNTTSNNEVVGTTWVLTYLKIGFATPPLPADTIRFTTNTSYTINGGAVRSYQLSSGVTLSSKTLTQNYHYPFGSGNYAGEVATTFVADGVILNCQFKNINSTTENIFASFKKI